MASCAAPTVQFIVNPRILYKGLQMNASANGRKVLPNNDNPSAAPTV